MCPSREARVPGVGTLYFADADRQFNFLALVFPTVMPLIAWRGRWEIFDFSLPKKPTTCHVYVYVSIILSLKYSMDHKPSFMKRKRLIPEYVLFGIEDLLWNSLVVSITSVNFKPKYRSS